MDNDQAITVPLPTGRMIGRIEGAIGWIIFNNPERRNAVSLEMWEAIPLLLDRYEQDPAVRVVVLRGAGDRAFVAGADISQFETQRGSPGAIAHYDDIAGIAGQRLESCGKPTIAMIQGYCIGGGIAIAACCDLRIAATGAKFGIPAARLGVGYGAAGVKKLLDLVGPAFVREIFLTARQFTADEAQAMGLVNRVATEAELEAQVRQVCDLIAENAPLTMLAAKRSITELLRTSPGPDLALCDRLVKACFASQDYIEGRRAFMEKRKPVFTGH